MDRLTTRFSNGTAGLIASKMPRLAPYANAITRLAAYEDTGLEPEEIKEAVELFQGADDIPKEIKSWVERCTWHVRKCAELSKALQQYKDTGLTPEEITELDSRSEITPQQEYLINEKADSIIAGLKELLAEVNERDRAAKLLQAESEGRLIVLPHSDGSDYAGLKVKYVVVKADTGEMVENCFVLRPDKDPAARLALEAYAQATDNQVLASDITDWIGDSGKVKVLPCKVGDTVWALWPARTDGRFVVYCAEVKQIIIAKRFSRTMMTVWLEPIDFRGRRKEYFKEDFGKLFFLTPEEAEAALGGDGDGL